MPTLLSLLALYVARTVNAGAETWTMPEGSQCNAAQVATATGLDMRTCWTATKDSYFGLVSKALILAAGREDAGAGVAGCIAKAKKEVMVADKQLLTETGWLSFILRVPQANYPVDASDTDSLAIPLVPRAVD